MCEQQIKKIFLDLSSLFIKKKKYIGTSLNDFNSVISTHLYLTLNFIYVLLLCTTEMV